MQTFLPYSNFQQSAACLDNKRLGKQRVECLQILQTLAKGPEQYFDAVTRTWLPYEPGMTKVSTVRKTPWYNHPAVKMWRGKRVVLYDYTMVICEEWKKRGFKDTVESKVIDYYIKNLMGPDYVCEMYPKPDWLGNEAFHASHRSNLLRKDPEHYKQFNWTEPNNLPYVWPV